MENTAIVRGTGRAVRPPARCRRSTAQPHAKRPHGVNGNGFLDHSFLPFWSFSGNRERIAREYFHSLADLCNYYGLPVPATDMPFPQNIYATWTEIEEQVKKIDRNSHCMILQGTRKKAVLSVVKTLDLSHCLFYIPVRPLWRWSQCAGEKRITELVTVIFAYLHQVVDIPFYAENGSFLDCQYDTLEQWVSETEDEGMNDDEDKAWRQQQEDTLYELRRAGGHIMPLIKNPYWLGQMEEVVSNYHQWDAHDGQWERLGLEFLQLYRQYPELSLPACTNKDLVYPDEDERITTYQYTGFYWSDKDCFQSELIDMIDCSFQEVSVMDEPTAVYFFDQMPDPERKDFDFENRLFDLIERLRDLLNDDDHE